MKNKYIIRSRISEKKFREILHLFSLDIEAKQTAEIVHLSRPTVIKIFNGIRERMPDIAKPKVCLKMAK